MSEENTQVEPKALETLHWTALKKLVEDKGGAYKGKEEAILFLRNAPVDAVKADVVPVGAVVIPAEGDFDKRRPYGEVCGEVEGAPGARYFQNGTYFSATGKKVG